jgi:hypothetical protein
MSTQRVYVLHSSGQQSNSFHVRWARPHSGASHASSGFGVPALSSAWGAALRSASAGAGLRMRSFLSQAALRAASGVASQRSLVDALTTANYRRACISEAILLLEELCLLTRRAGALFFLSIKERAA